MFTSLFAIQDTAPRRRRIPRRMAGMRWLRGSGEGSEPAEPKKQSPNLAKVATAHASRGVEAGDGRGAPKKSKKQSMQKNVGRISILFIANPRLRRKNRNSTALAQHSAKLYCFSMTEGSLSLITKKTLRQKKTARRLFDYFIVLLNKSFFR